MTTRDKILDAAAEVIDRLGLARATTKEIARAANLSEGSLYKHFRDKEELFTQVQLERMPEFFDYVRSLPDRAGEATVRTNLTAFARAARDHYRHTFPIAASLFADPRLLAAQRDALRRVNGGPHLANAGLAAYLRAEQQRGRISADADPDAAAALLVGACFQLAFLDHYAELSDDPLPGADDLADTLAAGLLMTGIPEDDVSADVARPRTPRPPREQG